MKFSEAIIKFFGEEVPSDETINEKFTSLLGEYESLKTEKEGLKQEIEQLTTEKAELEKIQPMAKAGEKYLGDMRKEAIKWYKLIKQEDASDEMIKIYESAELEEIKIIVSELQKEAEAKIPGSCPHCGKVVQKLNRRSSKDINEEEVDMLDRQSYQTG